jgi:serine/threonine protein kinase/tetratricopeptide (TPR) repeat protein
MDQTVVQQLTGVTVGRFLLRERLGGGGMGEVYLAYDPRLKKNVAMKRLNPSLQNNSSFRERFEREAQLGATLNHPHVASVYDVLDDPNGLFLLMEYVEGPTLRERMLHVIDIDEFLRIAVQCADALEAAHAKRIVHRDIKPENIMLTAEGQVKICDFGVAKLNPDAENITEGTQVATSSFIGTPAYAAPEIVASKTVDHRADLFSLGVVLYEMLARQNPFRSGTLKATNDRILHEVPLSLRKCNTAVPRRVERIIRKLLEKDAANRYATAAELLKDLNGVVIARRRKGLYKVMILAILCVVILAVVTVSKNSRPSSTKPTSLPTRKNLVILPFSVAGGTPENRVYSEGLVEILTAKLTQLTLSPELQVVVASDAHAKKVDTPAKAKEEFGANLVLAGGFQFSSETVKVSYSLIETSGSNVLRSDTISASLTDPFVVQDRIINAALRTLELQLKDNPDDAVPVPMTPNNAAMDAYIRGIGHYNRTDQRENIDNAINAFQEAIDRDHTFAQAYALIGQAYIKKFDATRNAEATEAARRYCNNALALKPNLAAAHVCIGSVNTFTGEYERAAQEFERAVQLEPTNDEAYRGLGRAYEANGKLEDAEQAYRSAISARPHYAVAYLRLGDFFLTQNRHEDAIEQYRQVLTLSPDNGGAYVSLGLAYANLGKFDEAIATLRKGTTLRPNYETFNNLGLTYMRARRLAEAIPVLEVAVRLAQNYRTTGNLARAYYWTPGMHEKAPAMYERAIKEGEEELRINPRNADAHILLGRYYAMIKRRAQASNHLEYALSVRPTNSHYLVIAAGAYNQLDDRFTALSLLERAVASGLTQKEIDMEYEIQSLRDEPRFRALKLN